MKRPSFKTTIFQTMSGIIMVIVTTGGALMIRDAHKYGQTKRYRVYLTDDQVQLHEQAIAVQNQLFNYALHYLYRTYGYQHLDRPLPTGRDIHVVINRIKALFLAEKFNLKRWNQRKLGYQSHSADEFLKTLFTNFTLYHLQLIQRNRWSDTLKYNFQANILKNRKGKHFNPKHYSWYRKGSLDYLNLQAGDSTKTIVTQGKPVFQLKSPHTITMSCFGDVRTCENLKNIDVNAVALAKLKRIKTGLYELQLTFMFQKSTATVDSKQAIGFDWNIYQNEVLHGSNDQVFHLKQTIADQADQLEFQINQIKSHRDTLMAGKSSFKKRQLNLQIQYLSAKRSNILTEEYRRIAREAPQLGNTIIVEQLDPFKMRNEKSQVPKAKGFNRRLALFKPSEFMQILRSSCHRQGKTFIQVDSYKTSQVEFGTHLAEKHELSELIPGTKTRGWISKATGKTVVRDLNSAKNIEAWVLNPNQHFKVWERNELIKKQRQDQIPLKKQAVEIKPEYMVTIS